MGIFEAFLIFTALLGFFLFVRIVRVKSELIYFSPFPHRTHISNIKKVNAYGELALSRLTNEIDQLDIFHDDDKGKIRINGWLFEPETLGELITDLKKENSQIILDSGALLLLDLYKQKHSQ